MAKSIYVSPCKRINIPIAEKEDGECYIPRKDRINLRELLSWVKKFSIPDADYDKVVIEIWTERFNEYPHFVVSYDKPKSKQEMEAELMIQKEELEKREIKKQERKQIKEEKKREKEAVLASLTPEQKRALKL